MKARQGTLKTRHLVSGRRDSDSRRMTAVRAHVFAAVMPTASAEATRHCQSLLFAAILLILPG